MQRSLINQKVTAACFIYSIFMCTFWIALYPYPLRFHIGVKGCVRPLMSLRSLLL
ncbi:hypothetical protein B4110_1808 [Parageobacillus toebii]|uniref:Uncharacterized protein n=1 Tax=Parageobacillus toebii TaxID=153151 RepID=A0A150N1K2_9BACL|nr:hypothetical protein B4110_1808 [Parageobacillus toebii]